MGDQMIADYKAVMFDEFENPIYKIKSDIQEEIANMLDKPLTSA